MRIGIRQVRRIIREEIARKFMIRRIIEGNEADQDRPPTNDIILVNDGSFNPVHRGHVNVTLTAKKAAESLGFNVVGLYMLPKHSSWLEKKFGKDSDKIIPDKDRLEFLEDAVSGTEITLDDWEIKGGSFSNNTQMRDHYEKKHPGATYVMIVGEDYGKCSPMPCFEMEAGTWQLRLNRTEGLSSTKIRDVAKSGGEGMDAITFPKVGEYMKRKYKNLSDEQMNFFVIH